jgi:hypothetical protein
MGQAASTGLLSRPVPLGDDFPILKRCRGPSDFAFLESLGPTAIINGLTNEVTRVFGRCSLPESTRSDKERAQDEWMMACVLLAISALYNRTGENSEAISNLFHKTLCTPDNLDCLFRMSDADVRTGLVRCIANYIVGVFANMTSMWDIKMHDGSRIASSVISVYGKALDDEAKHGSEIPHMEGCGCNDFSPMFFLMGLKMTQEEPAEVLERFHAFNWTAILQSIDDKTAYTLAYRLHQAALPVLHHDPEHTIARALLRKIGECHELYRSALRCILELKSAGPENIGSILSRLEYMSFFIGPYQFCLTPPPSEEETLSLVGLANEALKEARSMVIDAIQAQNVGGSSFTIGEYDTLTEATDTDWLAMMKQESPEERWQRFEARILSSEEYTVAGRLEESREAERQHQLDRLERLACSEGEMCANCFELEKHLREGIHLMRCSQCRLVT